MASLAAKATTDRPVDAVAVVRAVDGLGLDLVLPPVDDTAIASAGQARAAWEESGAVTAPMR